MLNKAKGAVKPREESREPVSVLIVQYRVVSLHRAKNLTSILKLLGYNEKSKLRELESGLT